MHIYCAHTRVFIACWGDYQGQAPPLTALCNSAGRQRMKGVVASSFICVFAYMLLLVVVVDFTLLTFYRFSYAQLALPVAFSRFSTSVASRTV